MNSRSNYGGAALPQGRFTAISLGRFEACAIRGDAALESYGHCWRQVRR